ncbi:MAG: hypothetical protein LVQ95_04985 [Candidatus Micrarchaeales archaeon]|nr:hypothetical protein [Candidatus Micrarchaeales archaeon]
MIPKVRFVYSPVYQMVVLELRTGLTKYDEKVFGKISRDVWKHEDIKKKKDYAKRLQLIWDKEGVRALMAMSRIVGFGWDEKIIKCYLLDSSQSFSDPMTIRASYDIERDIEGTLHEMGHNLEVQNLDRINWKRYNREFGKEDISVRHHILLHAILKLAYVRAFGHAKAEKYLSFYGTMPHTYARAWEIVNSYGAEKIIKDFIKG